MPPSCLFLDLNVNSDSLYTHKIYALIRIRKGRLRGLFFPSDRYFPWLFILIPQRDFGRQTTTPEQRVLVQYFNISSRAGLNKATQIYLGLLNQLKIKFSYCLFRFVLTFLYSVTSKNDKKCLSLLSPLLVIFYPHFLSRVVCLSVCLLRLFTCSEILKRKKHMYPPRLY